MNAKLAKKLRKIAAKSTIGLPPRELVAQGNDPAKRCWGVNSLKTTRGTYRFLKRQALLATPGQKGLLSARYANSGGSSSGSPTSSKPDPSSSPRSENEFD